MILAGYLTDKISRKAILILIFSLRALSYVLLHFCESLMMFLLFAALFGLADYSVVPPVVSLLVRNCVLAPCEPKLTHSSRDRQSPRRCGAADNGAGRWSSFGFP